MPLTTVSNGRTYDWSHAVGRGAATGTGFNYPQTMCLGNDGDIYVANRGNENNFGQRVNRIKLGGPGEEELLAEFFTWGEGDGKSTWPFGVAVDQPAQCLRVGRMDNTISVFHGNGKFIRKWGKTGSGDGELLRPAGLACDKNGNVIVVDSGNNRLQVFTGEGKFLARYGKAGSGDGEFNQPWGITLDTTGNIYVADWKNHRIQKLSPDGTFLMKIGEYGTVPAAAECVCRDLSRTLCVNHAAGRVSKGRAAQSSYRRGGRQRRRHLHRRLGQPSDQHLRRSTAGR